MSGISDYIRREVFTRSAWSLQDLAVGGCGMVVFLIARYCAEKDGWGSVASLVLGIILAITTIYIVSYVNDKDLLSGGKK